MSLTVLQDPEAERRSLMSQRVPTCNGHRTGMQCEHYWFVRANIKVLNADHFREGERFRRCMLVMPVQSLDYNDLATECTMYKASGRPYDPAQEGYDPLTDEEIEALQQAQRRHTLERPNEVFLPALALSEYKKLAAENPDDPHVQAVRTRAQEQSSDLEARKREGEEAKRRNQAEAAERERLAALWEAERPAREAAERVAREAAEAAAREAAEKANKPLPQDILNSLIDVATDVAKEKA